MSATNQGILMLISIAVQFFSMVVLARFLLQLVQADFYNPVAQFIVKATQPLLAPLRRLIPGYKGMDIASLVLLIAVQMIGTALIFTVFSGSIPPILYLLVWAVIGVLNIVAKFYFGALLISVIASWIAQGSYNPALALIAQLTEPVLRPLRKVIPPMGGLDFSVMIAILILQIGIRTIFIGTLAQLTQMPGILL